GASDPVSTVGPETVLSGVAILAPHSVTSTTVTQYQVSLDAGAVSSLNSITPPTVAGDDYWYDSGTSVTLTLNGVYARGGGTGMRLADYTINGGGNQPAATLGTVSVISALAISSPQAIGTTIVTQFQVTLDATTTAAMASLTSPTIAGDDYWYDSGTSVTLTLNGVWGRTLLTGDRLTSYQVNGGAVTPVATTGTTNALNALAIGGPQSVTSASTIQFHVSVVGGNGVTYGLNPSIPGDIGWYDSGSSLSVSSNGIYNRAAGTGQRVSSWNIDGGPNTAVATAGTVTTSLLTMTAAHTVTFNSVAQYQVTLNAGAQAALASCTNPTIAGDNYWYDSAAPVTCTLNGVYGRSGGTGNRLASYTINGGASTMESTTGIVTALNLASISSPQTLAAAIVVQYQLTLSVAPPAAGTTSFVTSPTIPGDTGWYDSGTYVTFSITVNPGFSFARWLGGGACSYIGGSLSPGMVLTCPATEQANFEGDVTQPIVLRPAAPGVQVPQFTINGCDPEPALVLGDGAPHSVVLDPACPFDISIMNSGSTRFGFSVGGQFSSASPAEMSCATGTCPTITITFYEQIDMQFAFATNPDPLAIVPPTLTCTQLGTTGGCGVLGATSTSYWLDYDSTWSATNPLSGGNSSVRFFAAIPSGTVTSPATVTVIYSYQFNIQFAVSPAGTGTTNPATGTSEWVFSGSSVSLSALPSSGYTFGTWTSTPPGKIAFGNGSALSTSATIGGPGVITAEFKTATFQVTFTESGLPVGTAWLITVDGQTHQTSSSSISLALPAGAHMWSAQSPISGVASGVRYLATPTAGSLSVSSVTVQAIDYSTQFYLTVSVSSTASGITLSPASGWYDSGSPLTLNATAAPSLFMAFTSWSGTGLGSYTGPDATAGITMNGPIIETATFTAESGTLVFSETGLPIGTMWSVTVDGVTQNTTGTSITFGGLAVGSNVGYSVQTGGSNPETGSVQIPSPQVISVTVTFTTSPSTVTSTITSTVTSSTTGSPQISTSTSTSTTTATSTLISTVSSETTIFTSTATSPGQVTSQLGGFFAIDLLIILILAAAVLILARMALERRRARRETEIA
ncbi:MAG: hypothetical protein OK456_10370, partial [Thaumarchaeota archaeon]|nr:hypothetical protein [Nitrososphaerota archaeon]